MLTCTSFSQGNTILLPLRWLKQAVWRVIDPVCHTKLQSITEAVRGRQYVPATLTNSTSALNENRATKRRIWFYTWLAIHLKFAHFKAACRFSRETTEESKWRFSKTNPWRFLQNSLTSKREPWYIIYHIWCWYVRCVNLSGKYTSCKQWKGNG